MNKVVGAGLVLMLLVTLGVFAKSFTAQAALPSTLYGAIGNHLAILDKTTGDAIDVGVMGSFPVIEELTFDSITGTLYGIARNPADPYLISIDRVTGLATVIGPMGFTLAEALAFNPIDGLLYGAAGNVNTGHSDKLVTVNPATGAATEIATFTGAATDVETLEWVDGILYAVDAVCSDAACSQIRSFLYTVALGPGTAIVTLVGEIGFFCCNDVAYDPKTNKLFANEIVRSGGGFEGRLIAISLSTGQGTLIGDTPEFNGGRLTGLAVVLPRKVAIDIKPQSCPNPLNVNDKGVLPVAILGTPGSAAIPGFDAAQVDVTTVRLEGIAPLRSGMEDVATPFVPFTGKSRATDCTVEGADGFMDLTLQFDAAAVVAALGPVADGDVRVLMLTGNLKGTAAHPGASVAGEDIVVIRKKK